MTKNSVIERVIDGLMRQRDVLSRELTELNYNEPSALEKKNSIDKALMDIDMNIDRRIMDCEITPL